MMIFAPRVISMHKILPVLILAGLLGACSSIEVPAERSGALGESSRGSIESFGGPVEGLSSTQVETSYNAVDASEDYKGLQTAAVAPVADRRASRGPANERLRAEIQQSVQRQLDRSGMFAGVVALDCPDEENEAEVIIEPALVGPSGYDRDHLELEVRVTEKTKRKVVLDEHYEGDDPTDVLKVAITELEDDLGDRYQR
jgi:hypothetical protein